MERKIIATIIDTFLCTNNQMIHMLKLDNWRLLEELEDRDATLTLKVDILKVLAMIIEFNARRALDALESMKEFDT